MVVNPSFKLNGREYSKEDLFVYANELVRDELDYEKEIGSFLLEWLTANNNITVFTSGSTGSPKSIGLRKEQMINSALATANFFNLKENTTALLCLPCNFIAGKMMLVRAMVNGWHLDFVPPNSKPLLNNKKTYDFAAMIPLQLESSISELNAVKTLIVGGAPVSNSLKKKVATLSTSIYETYGMTETITHIALKQINNKGNSESFTALPTVSFSVDNRSCLQINAPDISNSMVVTNDVVQLLSSTSFNWLGRVDNIINSGGLKLIPEQIETIIAPLILNRFFVTGVPDKTLGQKLVLLIQGEIDTNATKQLLATSNLSKYQLPKEIYCIPEFKETTNGKINRNATVALIPLSGSKL